MCSWGNGLIQCLGYGTEDLSQSSEPMWRHKLLLKDLRLGSPSVSFFFFPLQRLKRKIFHFAATVFVRTCGGHLAGKINDVRVRGESDTEKRMCYFLIINALLYTVKSWALVKRFHYLACPPVVAE